MSLRKKVWAAMAWELACLWSVCYAVSTMHQSSWAIVPTIATGVLLAIYGVVEFLIWSDK
jgi:FtsH-binding integral membrane protein